MRVFHIQPFFMGIQMNKNLLLAVACGLSVLSSIGTLIVISSMPDTSSLVTKTEHAESVDALKKSDLDELAGRLAGDRTATERSTELLKRVISLEKQSVVTSSGN